MLWIYIRGNGAKKKVMKTKKYNLFLLISIFSIVLIIVITIINFPVFSREKADWNHISFTAHRKALKFFDHETGKIYVYKETTGKIAKIWELEKLGKNLKRLH